ncbi:alpha/beta hydrolase [Sphingomonas lutea]|uniref:Alpha/beta hydrolase n=1 Tax=Sphingomonas lutea TaxID=1045317 RepID=A0A7G9SHN3_9SPHN|nr:alpha/beta hydrolase [Sphingomonas lutea]QNN67358.1 alpha/beta hydrolase [Sphingomonas lutea]
MRTGIWAALAAAAIGGAALAQERAPLPPECRQQIMALCQSRMGGGMRACVRTALPQLSDDCRKAVSDRAAQAQALPPGMREVAYGPDVKQKLDYTRPAGAAKAPILLFIHGGGWAIGDKRHASAPKAAHFSERGWAYASINYRLVPSATVEQQAADVAAAIAWLRANASANHLDADRIVLMGHSAGAHLAALVATDPSYLAAAKVPMSAVDGVVLLDGAGYDVPAQMASPRNVAAAMYAAAFGTDPARHARLSPTRHAAAPNVANWLILPVAHRPDSNAQSRGLAAALSRAGAKADVVPVPNESHGSLNRGLGEAGDFATARVDAFLAALH